MARQTKADLQAEVRRLEARCAEAERLLEEERRWLPAGVHIVKRPSDGGMSRLCFQVADLDDLEQIMPLAALYNHSQAITNAVAAIWQQVRDSVRYDGRGSKWITFPAPVDVADQILQEIRADRGLPGKLELAVEARP